MSKKVSVKKFRKVLVANRGEIAIRIFRALSELGITTVSIYSKEDRYAMFRSKADESYPLNPQKGPIDAYLDIDTIIKIALSTGVDAIHPGYGFLSENPDFADACERNGIVFIGPGSNIMNAMGDKISSKKIAIEANVPIIPGVDYAIKEVDEAKKIAAQVGYPVMLKASNGGGGRGMRIVNREEDLEKEFLIEGSSKTSNVIELSCTDYEKNRGTDMLDTLIAIYNKEAEAYKKGEARKSLVFLDGRIENIIAELAAVENQIEEYKSKNQLMDIEHDVQFYVEQMKELQTKLIELEAQSNVINMMDEFVKDPANKYNLVPVLLTAQEGEKGSALTSYNEVLLERARVIQNSSINNPLVGTLTEQADKLRGSVIETIGNAQKGMQRSIKDVKAKEQEIYSKMNNYPVAERQFVELKRRQEIIQGVYLILLQKREETALILGQTRDKARVIDPAYVKSKPVGPRKLFALIGMLVLTLVISYLFVRRQSSLLIQEYKKQSKDSK